VSWEIIIFVFDLRKNSSTAEFNREYEKICTFSMTDSVCSKVTYIQLADGCCLMSTKCSSQLSLYIRTSGWISKDEAVLQIHTQTLLYWRVKNLHVSFVYE
jgi:hypothetical protein